MTDERLFFFNNLRASRLYVIIYSLLQQSQKHIICVRGSQVTDLENYLLIALTPNNLLTTYQLFLCAMRGVPLYSESEDSVNLRISCKFSSSNTQIKILRSTLTSLP